MRFDKNEYFINWSQIARASLIFFLFMAIVLYTFWPLISGSQKSKRTIIIYGFSILDEVMNKGIYPAFNQEWQKDHQEKIEFISSFAGSGTITNQIIMGVPAQLAILSLELDALRLASNGIIKKDSWKKLPNKGILNITPIILLVRSGNPKHIEDFKDLTKDGIRIIHPDPLTSGGAQWAILAEYGSAFYNDKSDAYVRLKGIWQNVISQASSARAARTQFTNGFGDVLITYEQEALNDKRKGKLQGEIVYPKSTILTELTLTTIDKNISSDEKHLINEFIKFLFSEKGQEIFAKYGFRSINDKIDQRYNDFGKIENPFKINELGGWIKGKNIIDSLWKGKVLKEIKK